MHLGSCSSAPSVIDLAFSVYFEALSSLLQLCPQRPIDLAFRLQGSVKTRPLIRRFVHGALLLGVMSSPRASSVGGAARGAAILDFFHGGVDPLGRTHDEMLAYSLERMEECHDYVQWMWPLHEPSAFAVVFPVLTRPQVAELSASAEARGRMLAGLARFRLFYGLPASAPAGAEGACAAAGAAAGAAGAADAVPASASGGGGSSSEGGQAASAAAAASAAPLRSASSGSSGSSWGPRAANTAEDGPGVEPEGAALGAQAPAAAASGAQGMGEEAAAGQPLPAAAAAAAAVGGNDGLPPDFSPERASQWAYNGDHNLLRITRIIRSLRFFGLEGEAQAFYQDALVVARWARLSKTTQQYWRKAAEDAVWQSMRG